MLDFSEKTRALLAEVRGLNWQIIGDTVRVRGTSGTGRAVAFCPLGAVAAVRSGRVTDASSYGDGWVDFAFDDVGDNVVEAADNRMSPYRPALLKALGLTK